MTGSRILGESSEYVTILEDINEFGTDFEIDVASKPSNCMISIQSMIKKIYSNIFVCFQAADNSKSTEDAVFKSCLFSGNYFESVESTDTQIKAKCVACGGLYRASKKTTSNLTTHLKV